MLPLDIFGVRHKRSHDAQELQPEHLEGFRKSQQLAYACCVAVEQELREGITELQTVKLMRDYMADHGVQDYFHGPVAWFGDRSALRNMHREADFYPSDRALEPGMPAILDQAPVVDGYTSDVGYPCKLGDNAVHDRMRADLEPYRALILEGVRGRKHLSQIYGDVDRLIRHQGYENRHQRYGGRVLAHRVNFVPPHARTHRTLLGYGLPAVKYLVGRRLQSVLGGDNFSPFWNDRRESDHVPEPGLWAVEPHLGLLGIGAKWEELLVVTENGAHWLDDDLPHVRYWKTLPRGSASADETSRAQGGWS